MPFYYLIYKQCEINIDYNDYNLITGYQCTFALWICTPPSYIVNKKPVYKSMAFIMKEKLLTAVISLCGIGEI